jgi:hypothetical protein
MARIDAQGQQQGIERDLHHPGGGKSISRVPLGHAHNVNALREALEQGRNGTTHTPLPSCGLEGILQNGIANEPRGTAWNRASQPRIIGVKMAN